MVQDFPLQSVQRTVNSPPPVSHLKVLQSALLFFVYFFLPFLVDVLGLLDVGIMSGN